MYFYKKLNNNVEAIVPFTLQSCNYKIPEGLNTDFIQINEEEYIALKKELNDKVQIKINQKKLESKEAREVVYEEEINYIGEEI